MTDQKPPAERPRPPLCVAMGEWAARQAAVTPPEPDSAILRWATDRAGALDRSVAMADADPQWFASQDAQTRQAIVIRRATLAARKDRT